MDPEEHANPGRSPESLEARLRGLPRPPVPAELEARLLAAVPPQRPIPRRHRTLRVGLVGIWAAACLVIVFAWPARDDRRPGPRPPAPDPARRVTPRPPAESGSFAAWREAERAVEESEAPAFTWPLPESPPVRVAASVPSELFD
jgi:hypothetical protein